MPPRPSRNLDRALLAAGRELFPTRGCAGLSVREVAEAAGVNLGMFHYHFKSREAYLRALLQGVYEDMYSQLGAAVVHEPAAASAVDQLRAALLAMARFVRAHRPMLTRVLADAACGDPIVLEFAQANFPRHLGVLQGLIAAGQASGELRALPLPQALGFCAGSLAMPILVGGAAVQGGALAPATAKMVEKAVLSDAALAERVDLALAALRSDAPKTPRRSRK